MQNNDLGDGSYAGSNLNIDPGFIDPSLLNWHLVSFSPVINEAPAAVAPDNDLDRRRRRKNDGWVDMGAYDWRNSYFEIMRMPEGILGAVPVPPPGSSTLGGH